MLLSRESMLSEVVAMPLFDFVVFCGVGKLRKIAALLFCGVVHLQEGAVVLFKVWVVSSSAIPLR